MVNAGQCYTSIGKMDTDIPAVVLGQAVINYYGATVDPADPTSINLVVPAAK